VSSFLALLAYINDLFAVTASDDTPDDDPDNFSHGEGYMYSFRTIGISSEELFSLHPPYYLPPTTSRSSVKL
jgi:hypothetical protein